MTEFRSRSGLITGVLLAAGLAAQAGCAPPPVTRTVTTEQVTTSALPPPPPQMITTTTESVAPPTFYGARRTAPPLADRDYDVDEEVTETIVPAPAATPRQRTILTTTRSSTTN